MAEITVNGMTGKELLIDIVQQIAEDKCKDIMDYFTKLKDDYGLVRFDIPVTFPSDTESEVRSE